MAKNKKSKIAKRRLIRANKKRQQKRDANVAYDNLEPRQLLATVTTTMDVVNPSDGLTSLREAIISTNNSGSDDTINFVFSAQTIQLSDADLLITDDLTINGNGNIIVGDTDEEVRVLNVSSNASDRGQSPASLNLTLNNITISGGRTDGEHDIDLPFNENYFSGGGIRFNSTGTLTLNNSTVSNNGAIDLGSKGGGIFAVGPVVLNNSQVTGNYTGLDKFFGDSGELGAGGGVFSETSVSLNNSDVTNNKTFGYGAGGAGIGSFGNVTLDNGSTVSGNFTDGRYSDGGGIFAGGFKGFSAGSSYSGADVVLKNGSIVSNNHTRVRFSKGGGIAASGNVTLESGSAVVNNHTGGKQSHGGGIYAAGEITIDNSTLSGNHTEGGTTKLAEVVCKLGVELAKQVISSALPANKVLDIVQDIYTHLSTINTAFGIVDTNPCPEAFGSGGYGGGAAGGMITVIGNSNVTGNFTDGYGAKGGALFSRSDVSITNSTVDGNETRQTQSVGGAIYAVQNIMVTDCNIENNKTLSTNASGGAIAANFSTGTVTIVNSLVKDNSTAGSSVSGSNSRGGAVFAGNVVIQNSEFDGNHTTGDRSAGGAIFGENSVRVMDSVFTGNYTTGDTGNIAITSGSQSPLRTNQSGGGAIAAKSVTANGTTFSGNHVDGDEADGGAVYGIKLTLINSTVHGNAANDNEANGGGVWMTEGLIVQSTISGNAASNKGGGVFSNLDLSLANSIVLGNLALDQDGDSSSGPGNELHIGHTFGGTLRLVGANIGDNSATTTNGADVVAGNQIGTLLSNNPEIVFDSSTEITGTGVKFGDLDDNLGLPVGPNNTIVRTVALKETTSNPAIDASSNVASLLNLPQLFQTIFSVDQRNFVRGFDFHNNPNIGGTTDLGSTEVHPLSSLLTVTNDNDTGSGSLRAAVAAANINPGTDTITFDNPAPGQSTFNIQLGSEIPITESLIIDGSNEDFSFTRVDGATGALGSRIFNFTASTGDLIIRSLSLENGKTTGNNGIGVNTFSGGGIRSVSSGEVRLINSYMFGNLTTGTRAEGGAIFTTGNVVLVGNSELGSNHTSNSFSHGGAISANEVNVYGGMISTNHTSGSGAKGGAIYANDVKIHFADLDINSTENGDADGGAIFSTGDVLLDNVLLYGNYTKQSNSSGGAVRAVNIFADSSFAVDNRTMQSGSPGGALYATGDVTLANSIVEKNYTVSINSGGGGIAALQNVEIINSSIIDNFTRGQNSGGGGVRAGNNAVVRGSTISNNHTAQQNSSGGGINVGSLIANGLLTLTSSTVTGNSTGANIYNSDGGGINTDQASVSDSIILGNFSNDPSSPEHEIKGTVSFGGQNIVGEYTNDFNVAPFNTPSTTVVRNSPAFDVFANTVPTLFDSNGDGIANAISGDVAGVPEYHGGISRFFNIPIEKKTIALKPNLSNPALDGTNAPVNLFSFDGNADDGFGGNHGTIVGGLTAEATGRDGVSGTAVEFTGDSTQFIQLNSPLTIGSQSHTVELWVNLPATAPNSFMSFISNYDEADKAFWGTNSSGRANLDGFGVDIAGTTDLRDGEWHHVAFVRNAVDGSVKILVDGILEASATGSTNVTFSTTHRIGRSNTVSDALTGTLDELTIHGSALTDEQIRVRAGFDNRVSDFDHTYDRVVATPGSSSAARMDIGAFESTAEVASLIVTTLSDTIDPLDGFTSLREAIAFADSGDADGVNGLHDTITFLADLGGTILLQSGQLEINQSLSIDAAGIDLIKIDAADQSRVIEFLGTTGDLEVSNLVLFRGDTNDTGGAIKFGSSGTLTLTDARVTQSKASIGGGGIYATGDIVLNRSVVDGNKTTGIGAYGGGALSLGSITATNSTIYGNGTLGASASGGGLAGYSGITLLNSAVVGNFAGSATSEGGGLFSAGNVNVANSILLENFAGFSNDEIAAGGSLLFTGNNLVGKDPFAFNAASFPNVENAAFESVFEINSFDAFVITATTQPSFSLLPSQFNPALDAGLDSLAPTVDSAGNPRVVDLPTITDQIASNFVDLGPRELQLDEKELQSTVVTTSADVVDPFDLVTSLREAIIYANQFDAGKFENGDADGDGSAMDRITFASGVGEHFDESRTISLFGQLPKITSDISISGTGETQLIIDALGNGRSLEFGSAEAGTFVVESLTLRNGVVATSGGAILINDADDTLLINGVRFLTNLANGGGAISITGADFEIYNSSFVGNVANFSGSAIHSLGNATGWIANTTFSANSSAVSGAGVVFVQAGNGETGEVNLRNATIADSEGNALQIFAFAGGTGTLNVGNTIVSNSTASNVVTGGDGTEIFTSLGNNISDDSSPVFNGSGDLTNTDPLLTPINFSGSHLFHGLQPGSPALDGGDNSLVANKNGAPLTTDQRGIGFDRFFDSLGNGTVTVDIGAIEVNTVVDAIAPTVLSVVINGGDNQRSMVNEITVTFNEVVNVSASSFILQNIDTSAFVTPIVATQVIEGKTVVTLTFSGAGIIGGSLADGDYTLTILDTITDSSGNQLDGNADGDAGGNMTDDFFRFYGDFNGDRTVNIIDFFQFRNAFSGTYNAAFDFNGDGVVNIIDFFQFRSRFGSSL